MAAEILFHVVVDGSDGFLPRAAYAQLSIQAAAPGRNLPFDTMLLKGQS